MSPSHPTLQVLGIANVRSYLVSRFFSSLGRSILTTTIAWHLWKLTGSYFYLGVLGFIEFVPVIPVSLYAGAVADTFDRRRIVLATQLVTLGVAGSLAGAELVGLELPLILAAAFVLAVTSSFENPAGASILPSLVARELFPSATVVLSNARNVATVSGPVAMGFLAEAGGVALAYAASAVALAFSLAALAVLRTPPLEASAEARRIRLAAIAEGVRFVRHQPVILSSITLDMFAVIFAGATALLPVYADEILGVGERGYGLLSASMSIGTFAMAALLLVLPPIQRAGRALLVSVLFFGLATIVFGLSRSFALSVAAFALAGMADQVSMVTRSIILQLSTPDALRGRVNSVNMIFIGASNELGAAESGFLAALTSATFSVVAGGVACLGVLSVVAARVPELRGYSIGGSTSAGTQP
jgi:MFS family permease